MPPRLPSPPPPFPRMPDRPREDPPPASPVILLKPQPPAPVSLDRALAKRARRARKLSTPHSILSAASALAASLSPVSTPAHAVQALSAVAAFLDPRQFAHADRLQRQEALDDALAIVAVVELVGNFHEVVQVQELGLAILGSLVFCAGLSLAVVIAEVVETVVVALKTHSSEHTVVLEGLHALAALVRLHDVRTRILGRVGAIGIVVACLEKSSGDTRLVLEAIRFFKLVAIGSEGNKSDICWNGALEWMIAQLSNVDGNHIIPEDLVTEFCVVVRNLTVGRADIGAMVAKLGGIRIVLSALETYGRSEPIALDGLAGLFHLIGGSGEGCLDALVEWEGWQTVLCQLACLHFEQWKVQTLVFGIAAIVAAHSENNAQILVDAGLLSLALNAMHRHVTRRGLLYYGAKCVRVLLETTQQGMDHVRECGGAKRLLDVLYCSVARPVSEATEFCTGYAQLL